MQTFKTKITGKLYITSDLHGFHKNLTSGTTSWSDKSGCRKFDNEFLMTDAIVNGINKYVGEGDTLMCAGDWSFAGRLNIWNLRKRIKCKNVMLTYGNHDEHIINDSEIRIPYSDLELYNHFSYRQIGEQEFVNKDYFFGYPTDFFTELEMAFWFTYQKQMYVVKHYPERTWYESQHGSILAYGHEHSQIEHISWGKSFDAGIDNFHKLYNEYQPFCTEHILDLMQNRKILKFGHH